MTVDIPLEFGSGGLTSSLASIGFIRFIPLLLSLFVLYRTVETVYSVYFGPLSKVPGPKLAAATHWYEIYYDAYKPGLYWQVVKEMHQKYGPIVRVNPNEVHFDDPEYYNKIYNNTGKWDKDDRAARQFFGMGSIASTAAHDVHKGRRGILNTYFSRNNIDGLQPSIKWHLEKMCRRMREYKEEGKAVPLNLAFASLAADIVTNYLMPQPYYLLDTPDFSPSYYYMMRAASQYSQTAKNFAWAYPLLERVPRWLGRFASPIGTLNLEDQDFVQNQISLFNSDPEAYQLPDFRYFEGASKEKLTDQPPPLPNGFLIDHLLSKPLPGPPSEKSHKRLAQEFQVLIGAGSDQIALVLSAVIYYSLSNPEILKKILAELKEYNIDGDNLPDYRELEKLPYMNAAINEGLRITIPIASRLTRVAPDRDLFYKDYLIPAGTTVGMNMADLHHNEKLFPDPSAFIPERWLGPEAVNNKRNLVPFSKGSRNCVGMNLAYAEMPLITAAMFTRFDMELFETTIDDVRFQHDFFSPQAKMGTLGVQIKLR
ncbi:MAG: hypothetical protein M1812_003037 [Candelaria pacifica]|nr:MAG: hypothetical protein M1812_003037 [Candelaria pacifica]